MKRSTARTLLTILITILAAQAGSSAEWPRAGIGTPAPRHPADVTIEETPDAPITWDETKTVVLTPMPGSTAVKPAATGDVFTVSPGKVGSIAGAPRFSDYAGAVAKTFDPQAEFAPEAQILTPPLPPRRPSEAQVRVIPLGTTPGFTTASKAAPTPIKPVAQPAGDFDCPLKGARVTLKDGRSFTVTRAVNVYKPGPVDAYGFRDHPLDGDGYVALQIKGASGPFVVVTIIGTVKGLPARPRGMALVSLTLPQPVIRWGSRGGSTTTVVAQQGLFADHKIVGGPLDGASVATLACPAQSTAIEAAGPH